MNEVRDIFVSVVMITYKHEQFIAKAIEGVLMQKCDFEVELIIADDCSPDKTEEKVFQIIKNHPKNSWIKYTKHKTNKGMISNFNWALNQCKGKYIALCEGDDYWTDPLKLQKQVDFLEANEEYSMCFHDVSIIRDDGILVNGSKLGNSGKCDRNEYDLITGWHVPTLSVLFRAIYISSDLYSLYENYTGTNGDTILFSYLGKFGKAKFIGEIEPAVYRMHDGGVWSSKKEIDQAIMQITTYIYLRKVHTHFYKKHFFNKIISLSGKITLLAVENKASSIFFKYYSYSVLLSVGGFRIRHLLRLHKGIIYKLLK